jgi:phosphoribosylformylglycinamidine synthase PurS subunit
MRIGMRILPKKEVLDSQGRAVEQTLRSHGFAIEHCRVGKYLEIEVAENSVDQACAKVRAMADFVLYNPLIETYELEAVVSR